MSAPILLRVHPGLNGTLVPDARLLVRHDKAVSNREQRQLQAAGHARLVEDTAQVVLDGLQADAEALGDVAITVAGDDGHHNVEFTYREAVAPRRSAADDGDS